MVEPVIVFLSYLAFVYRLCTFELYITHTFTLNAQTSSVSERSPSMNLLYHTIAYIPRKNCYRRMETMV